MVVYVVIVVYKLTRSEYVDTVIIDDEDLVEEYVKESLSDLGKDYEVRIEPHQVRGLDEDEF